MADMQKPNTANGVSRSEGGLPLFPVNRPGAVNSKENNSDPRLTHEPVASRNIQLQFDLLMSKPPTFNPVAKRTIAQKSIFNRLLIVSEGQSLISDLVKLQNPKMYTISLSFLDLNLMPKQVAGFVPEADNNNNYKVFVKFEPEINEDKFPVKVEEGSDISDIKFGSSRIALTLFHELTHIWFELSSFETVDLPTGHDESGTRFDPRFLRRIKLFREQIRELDHKLFLKL